MKKRRLLSALLRIVGVTGSTAWICAVFPFDWMDMIHQWSGLGELPSEPIVRYLARSLSAFYGMVSGFLLLFSFDVVKYQQPIRWFGASAIGLGVLLVATDVGAEMPFWWTACEGPATMLIGGSMLGLARRLDGPAPEIAEPS